MTWRLRLQPTPPSWVDLGIQVPLMDTARAERELGWHARTRADTALEELLTGIRDGRDGPTPPLAQRAGGPARLGEVRTGVGARA